MRTITEPSLGRARPQSASESPSFNAAGSIRFIRGAIRNSPWVVIAITAHVVALTTLSVIYAKSHRPQKIETALVTRMVERAVEDDLDDVVAPPPMDRDTPPPLTSSDQPGTVNEQEVIIPEALPGARGEDSSTSDPNEEPGELNPDPDARPDLKAGATGGTSIGVGTVGHVGAGTSPWVSARLGKGGRGKGGRGNEGGGGIGGGPRTKDPDIAVFAALKWLKNHQSPDGHWDSDGFDAHCKLNRCDGPGEGTYDTGLTGLALLAFLGAGHTHQSGEFKDTVRAGLKYLRASQDSEGCFGARTSQHFLYNHACAALAMVEAYGMTGSQLLKGSAQSGIGFILKSRNPYGAWRYNYPPDGDNDTSVTGWMVMALKSAKLSNLDVEMSAVKDAIGWVEKMTEPEFGRTGYQQRGGASARTNEAMAKFPADKSESLTAVGLTVRLFGGRELKTDPMIDKGADLISKCPPRWDVDKGTIDFYYWYYASLAMFQVGGDRWKKWNEAMKTSLLDHQRLEKDRCEYGSWDPIDPWSSEGGRVYSTAINCLTMEVYYRYPVLGVRSEGK